MGFKSEAKKNLFKGIALISGGIYLISIGIVKFANYGKCVGFNNALDAILDENDGRGVIFSDKNHKGESYVFRAERVIDECDS